MLLFTGPVVRNFACEQKRHTTGDYSTTGTQLLVARDQNGLKSGQNIMSCAIHGNDKIVENTGI